MAKYTGYVTIPTTSYSTWKTAVINNGYDVDGSYGCQCWDLAAEFWWNVGFPQGYPTLAGTGSAYGAWDDRVQNAGDKFDLIYSKTQIKKGDVIVYNQSQYTQFGHIGFADEDYNGTDNINILSENNGGTPDPDGGAYTNVANYSLATFRGAFRYKAWHETPPTPPTPSSLSRNRFNWVLYARKLREKRNGL